MLSVIITHFKILLYPYELQLFDTPTLTTTI